MYQAKAAQSAGVRFYMSCHVLAVFVCAYVRGGAPGKTHHHFLTGAILFRGQIVLGGFCIGCILFRGVVVQGAFHLSALGPVALVWGLFARVFDLEPCTRWLDAVKTTCSARSLKLDRHEKVHCSGLQRTREGPSERYSLRYESVRYDRAHFRHETTKGSTPSKRHHRESQRSSADGILSHNAIC